VIDFKGKEGPKHFVFTRDNLVNGGKKGGWTKKKRAEKFAAVKAPPLNWGSK